MGLHTSVNSACGIDLGLWAILFTVKASAQ
ncbi:hypothetical protein F383_15359 [Gossypium arboreum]|uniref:Uncharacterized protein n=1 Tax=Gossypium arboreum TaxID=29729 RepID=A0A0B0NII4_GOSAR|nr:hypothetical protein F383_15359 [Gossypium arboreum]